MREAFDRRRQTMVAMLRDIPGVVCPEPYGAFYAYPSVQRPARQAVARQGLGHAAPSSPR